MSIGRLSSKLETHFKNLFENYAKRYREADREASADLFKDRLLQFVTEVDTGRSLFKERLKVSAGIESVYLCGGKLFLERVGLLEAALGEVGRAQEDDPQNKGLKSLALSLSEFGSIALLMQNKDYDAALKLLEALPAAQKREAEAVRLMINACLERGRMYFEANEFDDAFRLWKRASRLCGLDKKKAVKPPALEPEAAPREKAPPPAPKPEPSADALIERLIPDANERVFVSVLFMMERVNSAEEEFVVLMAGSILGKLNKDDQGAVVRRIPSEAVRKRMMNDLGVR